MQGVRESVAAGIIDDEFLKAARKAAHRASSTRRSPGGGDWSDGDIDDLVFDTVTRVEPDKVVLAAAAAASDQEFSAWLVKAMRTTLNLRARETIGGRVIRSVEDALRQDADRFELRNGNWSLKGDPRTPEWSEGPRELIETAWQVNTPTMALVATSTKTGRRLRRTDIREEAAAVLEVAGPLPKATLAEVVAHRFNVPFIERMGYLPGAGPDDGDEEPDADVRDPEDPFEAFEVGDAVLWMAEQLTEDERQLLTQRAAGMSIRAIADEAGIKKNQVEKLNRRLDTKLHRVAEQLSENGVEVVAEMVKILGHHGASRHSLGQDDGDPDEP
jgi:DNA-directed RNA polymerase specialized sigma24 family protein